MYIKPTLVRHTLAVGLLAAFAAPASATVFAGDYTYLGSFTVGQTTFPAFTNSTANLNGSGLVNGAGFDDYWVFQIAPVDVTQSATINFDPIGSITGFGANLFSLDSATCGLVGSVCNPVGAATLISAFGPDGTQVVLAGYTLTSGYYAIQVQGNIASSPSTYSGQASFTAVPEPAILGLLGLGLLGIGVSRRRKV